MKENTTITHNNKIKKTMPVKNLSPKKNTGYVYTEADLGEGLLHAGVSQLYWITREMNKKIKSIAISANLNQQSNGQSNFCY
jgi:hypothetical protein